VSEFDREVSIMRESWPTRDCCAMEISKNIKLAAFDDVIPVSLV
jgi:hypothetical protein